MWLVLNPATVPEVSLFPVTPPPIGKSHPYENRTFVSMVKVLYKQLVYSYSISVR